MAEQNVPECNKAKNYEVPNDGEVVSREKASFLMRLGQSER